jgi:hypothetical protein
MPKRIETDIQPINPLFFDIARDIAEDRNATRNEKLLAQLVEEFGLTVNILLARLEYGQVVITDEPSSDNRQYARRHPRPPRRE